MGLYIDEPIYDANEQSLEDHLIENDEMENLNFRVNFMRLNHNGVPDLVDNDSDDVPDLADEDSDDDGDQDNDQLITPVRVYVTEKVLTGPDPRPRREFEEYPDLGPAKKFRVNRMDISHAEPDSPPPLIDIDETP